MFTRQIGRWRVQAGEAEDYEQAWGEDGAFTRRVPYLLVQAVSDRGRVYTCNTDFPDEAAAAAYLGAMPESWTPVNDGAWGFDRNAYGSEAYQDNWHQEEYDRMDYQERRGHGYAG